ncbi:MAG: SH3-like domain-containing protein, partial [Pseudonocardiaceae bacterium]
MEIVVVSPSCSGGNAGRPRPPPTSRTLGRSPPCDRRGSGLGHQSEHRKCHALAAPEVPCGARAEQARPPRFAVGETVRAKEMQPEGHTRLPGYLRGHRGVIEQVQP